MAYPVRFGPVRRGDGRAPAIVLVDPKFPHNVGATVRAASCYRLGQVWFTGERVHLAGERRFRLPREERMRGLYRARTLFRPLSWPFLREVMRRGGIR
jgi:hypothetical protein